MLDYLMNARASVPPVGNKEALHMKALELAVTSKSCKMK